MAKRRKPASGDDDGDANGMGFFGAKRSNVGVQMAMPSVFNGTNGVGEDDDVADGDEPYYYRLIHTSLNPLAL